MKELNESIYHENLEKSMIYVGAQWCGPCKMISPIIEEMANEATDYSVFKVDADTNKNILAETGVRSVPTILIYKDGEVVDRHVGMASKEQLVEMVKNHLN